MQKCILNIINVNYFILNINKEIKNENDNKLIIKSREKLKFEREVNLLLLMFINVYFLYFNLLS